MIFRTSSARLLDPTFELSHCLDTKKLPAVSLPRFPELCGFHVMASLVNGPCVHVVTNEMPSGLET